MPRGRAHLPHPTPRHTSLRQADRAQDLLLHGVACRVLGPHPPPQLSPREVVTVKSP